MPKVIENEEAARQADDGITKNDILSCVCLKIETRVYIRLRYRLLEIGISICEWGEWNEYVVFCFIRYVMDRFYSRYRTIK